MSRAKYFLISLSTLAFYGLAKLTDLDLGGFGNALLISGFVFAIMALAHKPAEGTDRG